MTETDRPDIFEFKSFCLFLQAYIEYCKILNRNFSYQYFAKALGLANRSQIIMVSTGKRVASTEVLKKIYVHAKFSDAEKRYCNLLVGFERSKTVENRRYFADELAQIKPKSTLSTFDHSEFAGSTLWDSLVIYSMSSLGSFRAEPDQIASMLLIKKSSGDIKSSLKILEENKLLQKDSNVSLRVDRIVAKDAANDPVLEYHRQSLEVALALISTTQAGERVCVGGTVALKTEQIEEARRYITEFRDKFNQLFHCPEGGDVIYQFQASFLPLTKKS